MNLKKKLVAGTVAVSLVAGAGVAFASNAGVNLQDWYNGVFGKANTNMVSDVTGHALDKFPGVTAEYNAGKDAVSNQINDANEEQVKLASAMITTTKNGHVKFLNDKKANIAAGIQGQFDYLYGIYTGQIDGLGNQAFKQAKSDFTNHADKVKQEALNSQQEALTTAKNSAKKELAAAIAAAKTELQNKLDSVAFATTEALETYVDQTIDNLRGEMETVVTKLISDSQKDIAAGATSLQNDALADLDALVNDINQ